MDYREADSFPWDEKSRPVLGDRVKRGGRRLLDQYGESLKFVNALYNKEFGTERRSVPAHMPHFLDKDILNALQAR